MGIQSNEVFSPRWRDLAAAPGAEGRLLMAAPALWTLTPLSSPSGPAPRHQTLRRHGVAPLYPRPEELAEARRGTLSLTAQDLRLEDEAGGYCRRIPGADIGARIFHRDAAELALLTGERLLVGLDERDAELLDVLAQAYF